jgi:coxsackievirus/adenovirus receptor
VGSSSPYCNQSSGHCFCRGRTRGVFCDTCEDGYFDFSTANDDVCLACFCYNHSKNCQAASGYELKEISSRFSGAQTDDWKGTTAGGAPLFVLPTTYLNTALNTDFGIEGSILQDFVYFSAPLKFLGNQRFSYAQTLHFQLRLDSLTDTLVPLNEGDVLIKGRFETKPIVAAIDPLPGPQIRSYTIQLVESNFFWGDLGGRGVAINEMLDILSDIDYLRIRGAFGQVRHACIPIIKANNTKL